MTSQPNERSGGARKLRDLAKAGHLAQPEAYVVPTGAVLVHQVLTGLLPYSSSHF